MTLCLYACQPQHLPPKEFEAYVADSDNGLYQIQRVNNIEVGVTYQPTDLLALRDSEMEAYSLTSQRVDSLRRHYGQSTFFMLSFSRNGKEILQPQQGFSAYSELLQTLAFRMGDYVQLITERGDTLRPNNYYLDRTYGGATSSQILLSFPLPPNEGEWCLRIQEFGLGTGTLAFPFKSELTKSVPTVQFK